MGDFEIRGANPADNTGKVITTGVGFIDLDELAPQLAPVVVAPKMPLVETDEPTRPAIASPTNGPHRFTIVVPNAGGNSENSILSVGQAGPADRIQDTGITGMTKTHIHWHALEPQTMVLLGGKTEKHGWSGPFGSNNPHANRGFMMVTEGFAWYESRGTQYVVTREGDAVVRTAGTGKRLVLQADHGDIDFLAEKKIYGMAPTVTLMAPASFTPLNQVAYTDAWDATLPETTTGKTSKTITTVIGILTGVHDLGKKVPKLYKSWKKGKKELETSITDSAKWLLDIYKWGVTVNKQLKLFSTDPGVGQMKLGADADVGVLAGGDVGIWGGSGFSAGGGIWTSLSGGVSTSIKAIGWAGVGGMWTGIKGYRKVEVGSEYGKAVLKGKQDVDVTSEDAAAKVSAGTVAQVIAGTDAYVYGANRLLVAGGKYGLGTSNDGILLGRFSSADKLEGPGPVAAESFWVVEKAAGATFKSAKITLDDDHIEIKSKKLVVNAGSGNISMEGSKILIG